MLFFVYLAVCYLPLGSIRRLRERRLKLGAGSLTQDAAALQQLCDVHLAEIVFLSILFPSDAGLLLLLVPHSACLLRH